MGKDFTNWIKGRINKYEFLENEDYKFCSPKLASKGRGGHNITDYSLTLDMAKELSMVENNKIGRLWMLDIQLGRRNLSPIQRIAVAEKYRPIYETKAKENMSLGGKNYSPKEGLQNSSTLPKQEKIDVRAKLAETAGVSTDTYSKGKKILDSDNETLKQEVLSGEM